MSCKTETEEIGLREYSVTQWPATKSILMKVRLIKTFGATIAIIAGSADGKSKKGKGEDDTKSLSEGLQVLFQGNSPEEIVNLMKECVVGTACDGSKITSSSFDEIFSGDDLMEVYKVFLFVLKVNYANLMRGQLGISLLAKMKDKL